MARPRAGRAGALPRPRRRALTSLEEEFADASRAIGAAPVGGAALSSSPRSRDRGSRRGRGLARAHARQRARARTLASRRDAERRAEIRLPRPGIGGRARARAHPLRALAYLLPAYGRVDGSGTRFAIARAMASIDEERAVLRGHRSSIHSIEWSHDGRTLATVDEEAATRLWRFDRGRVDRSTRRPRGMFSVHRRRQGLGLGGVNDGSIACATVAGHKVARIRPPGSKATTDGHFSDTGGSLLLFRSDGVVWMYGADGKLRKRAATGLKIDFAAADRSGRRVFLAGETGGLHLWDMKRGKGREVLPVSFGGLAMSDRGDVVVAGGADGNTYVIDGVQGAQRHVLASHPGRHYTAVSRDGRWIATGGYDRTAKLWHAATGKLVATLHEHRGPVSVVAFDPSGQLLATASGDGTVRIYNTRGAMLAAYEGHTADILDLAWSPDGHWLASGAADGLVAVWPGRSPRRRDLRWQPGARPDRGVRRARLAVVREALACTTSPAARRSAASRSRSRPSASPARPSGSASARRTECACSRSTASRFERARREQPISVIGFSPDGRAMATISYDQTVRCGTA